VFFYGRYEFINNFFNYQPLIFRTLAFMASSLGYEIEKVIWNDCQMFGALNKVF